MSRESLEQRHQRPKTLLSLKRDKDQALKWDRANEIFLEGLKLARGGNLKEKRDQIAAAAMMDEMLSALYFKFSKANGIDINARIASLIIDL